MGRTYTTIQGDMWDLIAYKMYGSEKHMDILIWANLELLDTFIFDAGTVLVVPALESRIDAALPSWRQ